MNLHGRGIKPFDHRRALAERSVHIAAFLGFRRRKIWRTRPDLRGVFLFRIVFAHDERQRLRGDFDGAQRVKASLFARARDGGNFLAIETNRERHIAREHYRLDAGNLPGFVQIHSRNFCRRPFRAENHPVKPAGGLNIRGIARLAGDFRHAINARGRVADVFGFCGPARHKSQPPFLPRVRHRPP